MKNGLEIEIYDFILREIEFFLNFGGPSGCHLLPYKFNIVTTVLPL